MARIFVFDDNHLVRAMLRWCLESCGHEVVTFPGAPRGPDLRLVA